jgi:RNA polymerase sigma-70 factor (ECF subfamily)
MSRESEIPANGEYSHLVQYRPQLLDLAQRLVSPQMKSRIDPSDVVQETLLTATKYLPKYDAAKLPFLLWLFRLLRQRIIDAKRRHLASSKRSVKQEQEFLSPQTQQAALDNLPAFYQCRPQSEISALTRVQQLEIALQSLDEKSATLLRLFYFESMSMAEIAERFGVSVSAVKMRHKRAVDQLRTLIDDA